jgi:hypothetical protein
VGRPAAGREIVGHLAGHLARVADNVRVAVTEGGEPIGSGGIVASQVPEPVAALVAAATVKLDQ